MAVVHHDLRSLMSFSFLRTCFLLSWKRAETLFTPKLSLHFDRMLLLRRRGGPPKTGILRSED